MYQITERITKKIPVKTYDKIDVSYQREPQNVYGENTKLPYQFANPAKSKPENTDFKENGFIACDEGYGFSGDIMKSNPADGGFHAFAGRGSMSDMYLWPEPSIKQSSGVHMTFREKHGYDFERLMNYNKEQLKAPPLKECPKEFKNNEFRVNSETIAKYNLKSHISGYKAVNKGTHGALPGFNEYVPKFKNNDEKTMESSWEHYVQNGDTYRYGYQGTVKSDSNWLDLILRKRRDDKPLPKFHDGKGFGLEGRYAGYNGYDQGLK